MSYPDLMLTKAVSLERLEQQRRPTDRYADPLPLRVYRSRRLPPWLRRIQYSMAARLVAWGEKLQAYNATPTVRASVRPPKADCLETIQVRR